MDYRIKRVGQSDELEHALFGIGKKKSSSSSSSGSGQQGAKKGSTWSNHLYIARQKAGDKWRYFYSQAELQAARAKGAAKQAAKNVGDTARKGIATVKRSTTDASKKASDVLSGRYKRQVDENIDRSKDDIRRRSDANPDKYMGIFENNPYSNDRITKKIIETSQLGEGEANSKRFYDAINARNRNWDAIDKDITRINENERLQKGLLYKISDLSIKGNALVSKGKSAVSKLIGNTKDAAGKTITAASDKAKSLANKGKAAVDKLGKVLSGEYHKEVDLEGDRINEAMTKSNRTAKRLSGSSNIDKDNELLAYTSRGGRAQKHADETMDYASKQFGNEIEKQQSPYKVSKAIAGVKDKVEDAKDAAGKAIEKAQEDFYETRRDVREFAAKAKNFVTNKTYRNDKTYRDMVDGVKSMQEDLKSIDAYIRELKASPKMTPSIEKEIEEARALQDEIGNTMVSVRREVEKYKNN